MAKRLGRVAAVAVAAAGLVAWVAVPVAAGEWEVDRASLTAFNGPDDALAWDVAVQPDGLQVEAGEYAGNAFVLRFSLPLGRTDDGFEGSGVATLDEGGDEGAYGVALQADGAIVASGYADGDAAVWRLLPDGRRDQTFGVNGFARVDLGTDDDAAASVGVVADGRIVVAGWAGSDLALAALTSAGTTDAAFGAGGKVVRDLGSEEWAEALAVTGTGAVVVAGGKGDDTLVARYTASGSADASFGSAGVRVLDVGGEDAARDVTVDAFDRPVLAGGAGSSAYVARLAPNGLPDLTFAGDGTVVTSLRAAPAEASGVAVLPDGRIVIAGSSADEPVLAAFTSAGLADAGFGDGNLLL
ncbi:MAG: hypothetical protein ACRDPR_17430, partial [Nocardioidaceae bacterium]